MARIQKQKLTQEDLRRPDKLLEFMQWNHDTLVTLLNGGTTLSNLKQIVVTAEWKTPAAFGWQNLTLKNGATPWSTAASPQARWVDGWWECRELVRLPAGYVVGYSSPFATLPGTVLAANSETATAANDVFGLVAAFSSVAGTPSDVYFVKGQPSPLAGPIYLSLNGVRFRASPVPPETPPLVIDLKGEGGLDYGAPTLVFCLSATRRDRVPVKPDEIPVWDAPLIGVEQRKKRRVLRIHRLGGLEGGVSHQVTFLCLYA